MQLRIVLFFIIAGMNFFPLQQVQSQRLYGLVVEQSSNRKAVPNVTIIPTGANRAVSNNDGQFTLTFGGQPPGAHVHMNAQKAGWKVVSEKDLETNLPLYPTSEPHEIVMCLLSEWKKNNAGYARTINAQANKKENQNTTTVKDKPPTSEQKQQLQQRIPEIAAEKSNTNLDKVSEQERKAYELEKKDSLDKARVLREQIENEKNFDSARTAYLAGDSRNLEIIRRNTKALAIIDLSNYDFEKADAKFRFMALHDSSEFSSVYDYARNSQYQKQYDTAIKYYTKAVVVASSVFDKIRVWNNMGDIYRLTNAHPQARQILELAKDSCKAITDSNWMVGGAYKALTLTNLGLLYRAMGEIPKAENSYKTALELGRKQAETDPDFYNPLLASLYTNLGALYNDKESYANAENCYNGALQLYQKLQVDTLNLYDVQMATLYNNMGLVQTNQENFGAAEGQFKNALSILRKLFAANPPIYKGDLAETLLNYGDLFRKWGRYELAEQEYRNALQHRKELAETDKTAGAVKALANVQFHIGLLRADKKDVNGADDYLQQARQNVQQLESTNTVMVYGQLMADIEYSLGELYRQQKADTAAEKLYRHVLNTYRQMTDSLPAISNFQVALSYWSLGLLYKDRKNYSGAEDNLQQAYERYNRLARDTLEPYAVDAKSNALRTAIQLGLVLYAQERFDEAIIMQQQVLTTAEQLWQQQPGKYDEDITTTQINLGRSYFQKKDYEAARQYYWKAALALQNLISNTPDTYAKNFCVVLILLDELPAAKKPADGPAYQKMLAEALALNPKLVDKNYRKRLEKIQQSLTAVPPN